MIEVTEGEVCWLIEQTSTVDGVRRFWDGRGYGVDALRAARYPSKDGAEETAGLGHSKRTVISNVHGWPEVCEHLFQCGISSDIAELRKRAEEAERRTVYKACPKHQGLWWNFPGTVTVAMPAVEICPHCEQDAARSKNG